MADEDISLTEDQLLENLDDGNNGDSEFLNEVCKYDHSRRLNFVLSLFKR